MKRFQHHITGRGYFASGDLTFGISITMATRVQHNNLYLRYDYLSHTDTDCVSNGINATFPPTFISIIGVPEDDSDDLDYGSISHYESGTDDAIDLEDLEDIEDPA